jgi:hypothetical protein
MFTTFYIVTFAEEDDSLETNKEQEPKPPSSILTQDFDVEKHAARNKKLREHQKQTQSRN